MPAFRAIQLAEGHETHRAAGLWPEPRGRVRRRRAPPGRDGRRGRRCRELLAAHADRETVRAAFARLFEHADVLLTPAVPLAPPRIEDERADPALREAVLAYTAPQDLVGLAGVRAAERDAAHRAARRGGAPGRPSRPLALARLRIVGDVAGDERQRHEHDGREREPADQQHARAGLRRDGTPRESRAASATDERALEAARAR